MATERKAEVTWRGDLMSGEGTIEHVGSGAFGPLDVTWASRAEEPAGKTSPEELIAAAHAACFSMALSNGLAQAGHPADQLKTSATVTFQPGEGITKIALHVTGNVPGMSIDELIDELERSYQEAQERMSDPAVYNDHKEAAAAGRRLKELEGPHRLAQEWRQVHDDLEAARGDGVLRELVPELEERSHALEEELRLALAPTDPADSKDVIVEIRQGVGGDEAAIWAGDLYRALARYAERRGFKVEQLGASPNDAGGYKEVTFAISGDGAYSVFKWEGGTHRVQRVPETESQS